MTEQASMFISLLYPNEEAYRHHKDGGDRLHISMQTCEELGLSSLFSLKSSRLTDYFTRDVHIISYRKQALDELSETPALSELLREVQPILEDILELRRLDREIDTRDGDSYLYSITEIELYVRCIEALREGLLPLRDSLKSEAFRRLCDVVFHFAESEKYQHLTKDLSSLTDRVHEVRSITVGVNLDAQYRPTEAGVLSVNADSFKSGKTLDKILRLSFKNDAMTCIAPLTPFGRNESENRQEALTGAFRTALHDVFKSSIKGWRAIVGEYVLENSDFLLQLLPEIEFLNRAATLIRRLKDKGYSLCTPDIRPANEKAFEAYALYNPDVALRIETPIVPNDIIFDDAAHFYILSGPNRGGKSVVTCAMGLAQCLCQLGVGVPAERATVSTVDAVFTHFPEGAEDTIDKGRLGEECARLREIFDASTGDSMILLDESLSSTGSYEASFIAAEILSGFAARGCRGMFSTHLHELSGSLDDINRRSAEQGGILVDTLVADIEEEGKRSFKICRRKPDGKSYARDIARRYGLDFDNLLK